jgi:hypothetical protein
MSSRARWPPGLTRPSSFVEIPTRLGSVYRTGSSAHEHGIDGAKEHTP